jgi:uncharacterized membrane protein YphA (DoxX/SURF4 family)
LDPSPAIPTAEEEAWSPARLLFFRFIGCYLLLYYLPFPFDNLPVLDRLGAGWDGLWAWLVPRVGEHVLRLETPAVPLQTGSGDPAFAWVSIVCKLSLALLVAAIWSWLARGRRAHPQLADWLNVYLRFALGLILFSYGVSKILPVQFQPPQLDRLLQPYGQASPMALLWTFMGYSRTYAVFAGSLEAIGGVLLFFRRTTLLGALLIAAVMSNVVLLNFCFDVPVKQYSSHLLATALFLAWPDARRLADFFLGRAAVAPREPGAVLLPPRWRKAARVFKWAFLLFACGSTTFGYYQTWQNREQAARSRPLVGIWQVEQGSPATAGWRHVVFTANGFFTVLHQDGRPLRFLATVDEKEGAITLRPRWGDAAPSRLSFTRPDEQHLQIQGSLGELAADALLVRVDTPEFVLTSREFQWVTDYPFNQ